MFSSIKTEFTVFQSSSQLTIFILHITETVVQMNSLEKGGPYSPDTSERGSAQLCALFNGTTILDIISFLSVILFRVHYQQIKDLFELSLCNKRLHQMLESYPMYWDKRAALEFGISSSEGKAIEGDQFQLAFLEKEEQAGRMTVGMRNEKTEVDDSCLY